MHRTKKTPAAGGRSRLPGEQPCEELPALQLAHEVDELGQELARHHAVHAELGLVDAVVRHPPLPIAVQPFTLANRARG